MTITLGASLSNLFDETWLYRLLSVVRPGHLANISGEFEALKDVTPY